MFLVPAIADRTRRQWTMGEPRWLTRYDGRGYTVYELTAAAGFLFIHLHRSFQMCKHTGDFKSV